MPSPLPIHECAVLPEWIDYNGHMNVAYYVLAFDHATDEFLDRLEMGENYVKTSNHSTFVLEAHVNYLQEVTEGAPLSFDIQMLDYDQKRFHYFSRMYHRDEGFLAATYEVLGMHIDMAGRRAAAMPPDALARLEALMTEHAGLPRPELAGRVMQIRRKK
jgi:acyl-CoA thioester hydrolase